MRYLYNYVRHWLMYNVNPEERPWSWLWTVYDWIKHPHWKEKGDEDLEP